MNHIISFINGVKHEALINDNEIIGCSSNEIIKLKNKAKSLKIFIPLAYLDFLFFGGHKIGAMLVNCDFNYTFGLKQLDKIEQEKNTVDGLIFLQSWEDQFYFKFNKEDNNPFIHYLNSEENNNTQNRFSDFLLSKLQNYIDARKIISLDTRLALARTRRGLIDIKNIYSEFEDSFFYRSLDRVLILIDTLHQKEKEKRFSAKIDFIAYLDGLLSKSKKAAFITDDSCANSISLLKENFIYVANNHIDFDKMNSFKERINRYIVAHMEKGKTLNTAEAYISTWQNEEIKVNHQKKEIRIRAKWFKPQLIYFYNQVVKKTTK
jgi:hypothetical protein